MDEHLRLAPIRVPMRQQPKWDVLYGGQRIGRLEQQRIGRAAAPFFKAWVFLDGDEVNLEVDTDRDGRAERILAAWLDPLSVLQSRSWAENRERLGRPWTRQRPPYRG